MEALYGFIGVLIGLVINFWTHRENLAAKMVEIALGILAAEPDKTKGLRDWAVDTLARYSKVELTTDAKNALRNEPLPVIAEAAGRAVGSSWARGAGAVSSSGELFETPLPLREAAKDKE